MAHKDSKWPKVGTTKTVTKQDSARLCELFKAGEWGPLNKSGFFRVKCYNPKYKIFHMSVQEQVFKDSKKKWDEKNSFRNGYSTQHLTSVDIEEILRVGSVLLENFECYICYNLDFNPF